MWLGDKPRDTHKLQEIAGYSSRSQLTNQNSQPFNKSGAEMGHDSWRDLQSGLRNTATCRVVCNFVSRFYVWVEITILITSGLHGEQREGKICRLGNLV